MCTTVRLFLAVCENVVDLRSQTGDDSTLLKTILKDDLLSAAIEERDPWLANIGFSLLKDYDKALSCLVVRIINLKSCSYAQVDGRLKSALSSRKLQDYDFLMPYAIRRLSFFMTI